MRIEEKTVYVVNTRSFHTERAAQEYEADCIGSFIDHMLLEGIVYGPGDRLKLLDNILKNRAKLIELLAQ